MTPETEFDRRLAARIDHTCLRPEATDREIVRLCDQARRFGFAAVCLHPIWVPLAVRTLAGSVPVCTVVGFPHGAVPEEIKARETERAVAEGADEIDLVIPLGALKSGDEATVAGHIRAVIRAAGPGILTKVILETALLTLEEKRTVCRLAREEGASFVKTSTGFGPGGATVEDVRLLRASVPPEMGVKAAGGIRDRAIALALLEAGAGRLGASASLRIIGAESDQ